MSRKDRKTKKAKKTSGDGGIKRMWNVLGGSFLIKESFIRQFPFVVIITLMLMVLITNTYIAESRTREIADTTRRLNDLHVEYIQLKSEIMHASKQSVLSRNLSGMGIKALMDPIKRINVIDNQDVKEEEK